MRDAPPVNQEPASDTVAIVGPGLLGGSLALALTPISGRVRVWGRRAAVIDELRGRCPAARASTDLADTVTGADIVILCTPVGTMPEIATAMLPHLKHGAIVTDVGSVKAPVVARLEPILSPAAYFVGSHPMTGGDQAGIEHARADLFSDAACIITPTPRSDPAAIARLTALWASLGCRLFQLAPDAHDRAIALVSHLPHIAAASLVRAAARTNPDTLKLAGPGFHDSTRIAMGSAEMWDEILRENRAAVTDAIRALQSELDAVHTALSRGQSLTAFLADARDTRLGLRRQH
jgi:cyclohexadieny/prephenate dehydrogenase